VSETLRRVPAVEGWFTLDDEPALIGARCPECGTYVFPPRATDCPNPACDSPSMDPALLSRTGTLWSFSENHYPPPPPYKAKEPFEPYALAAVELETEGLIVLGQVATGIRAADLRVGMPMRLELDTLFVEDGVEGGVAGAEHVVYVWAPR